MDKLEKIEKEQLISDMSEKDVEKEVKKRSKDKNDFIIETSFFETSEFIFEQVENASLAEHADAFAEEKECSFIRYKKSSGDIKTVEKFDFRGKTYFPIMDNVFKKGGVSLPTGIKEYKNTKEITDQIKQYLTDRIEVPQNPVDYERFLPNLVLFYWLYDKFPFIPYVHFVGGTSTGKTTAMETFGSLCYKPVDSSSSLTIASMFRIATNWKGTLLIDEFEKTGEGSKEIILFLKAGVSNRLLYRTEGEKKKELVAYVIKSPKIFTSENPINDAGLQSRTMVIKMERNKRELPLYRLAEDYAEAQEIRNKLLLWRLRNFDNVDLSKIKYGFPELKSFDRRVQQIITPIYYFTDDETRKDIIEFAKEQEDENLRARRDSLDGLIFEFMLDIWNAGNEIQIKALTSMINEEQKGKGYKTELTEKRIGNIVRKVLGFETERRGHEKSYWVIRNNEKVESKSIYYGIPFSSPIASVSTANTADESNKDAELVKMFNEI